MTKSNTEFQNPQTLDKRSKHEKPSKIYDVVDIDIKSLPQSLQNASQVPRAHISPPHKTSRITLCPACLKLIRYVNMDSSDSKKEKEIDNEGKVRSSCNFFGVFSFGQLSSIFLSKPAITKYSYHFSLIC